MSWMSSVIFGPPGEDSGTGLLSFIVELKFVSNGLKIILYDLCPERGSFHSALGATRINAQKEGRTCKRNATRPYVARPAALLRGAPRSASRNHSRVRPDRVPQ